MSAFHPFLPRQLTTLGENSQFQWAADLPRANRSGALPISRRSRRPSCARDLRTPAAEVLRDQVANSQSAAAIRGAWNRHSTPQKLDADPLVHSFQVAEKFRRRLGDTRLCALIEVSRKDKRIRLRFFRVQTGVDKCRQTLCPQRSPDQISAGEVIAEPWHPHKLQRCNSS
jgi:hypothetical protein